MTDILHLTLKRKWFDLILSGGKGVEYREDKPYWERRLSGRHYDEVHLVNGYGVNRPMMRVECDGIILKPGKWHIYLGKILEVKNVS